MQRHSPYPDRGDDPLNEELAHLQLVDEGQDVGPLSERLTQIALHVRHSGPVEDGDILAPGADQGSGAPGG